MPKSTHTQEAKVLQDLLRQARVNAGLSQMELARRLSNLQAFVSNYETGQRRLDLIELCEVLDTLGVPLGQFISDFERLTGRTPETEKSGGGTIPSA